MAKYIYFLVLIGTFCLFPHKVDAQKYIKDSLSVAFRPSPVQPQLSFRINTVSELRKNPGHFLQISEKKQYLVIPVDFLYRFENTLSDEILNSVSPDTLAPERLTSLDIKILEFTTGERKGGFISQYFLKACLEVNQSSISDSTLPGNKIVYETTIPFKQARNKKENAYEQLITQWHSSFVKDLNHYALTSPGVRDLLIPGIRPGDYVYRKHLYTRGGFMAGIDWFGFEAEMFFSSPEVNFSFIRNTGTVRYINAQKYESILLGRNNENFYWRMGQASLFELQTKLMFGINRWKDIETEKHRFEEVFQLCLGLSQMFQYDIRDKRGIVISAGLVEDIFYIYNKIDYRLGVKFGLGIKL